jgi:hypothetical protein
MSCWPWIHGISIKLPRIFCKKKNESCEHLRESLKKVAVIIQGFYYYHIILYTLYSHMLYKYIETIRIFMNIIFWSL